MRKKSRFQPLKPQKGLGRPGTIISHPGGPRCAVSELCPFSPRCATTISLLKKPGSTSKNINTYSKTQLFGYRQSGPDPSLAHLNQREQRKRRSRTSYTPSLLLKLGTTRWHSSGTTIPAPPPFRKRRPRTFSKAPTRPVSRISFQHGRPSSNHITGLQKRLVSGNALPPSEDEQPTSRGSKVRGKVVKFSVRDALRQEQKDAILQGGSNVGQADDITLDGPRNGNCSPRGRKPYTPRPGRWSERANKLVEERKERMEKGEQEMKGMNTVVALELNKGRAERELHERKTKKKEEDQAEDDGKSSTKWTVGRRCHSAKEVSEIHGYLTDQNILELMKVTNYSRRELFYLFVRFKALCSLSPTPEGIDKETFRKAVPLLSVEDDLFVDRVFEVLDEDGSECIEWAEFLEAMSALEKGSREDRTAFLFKVYDEDHDGGISKDELYKFFLSSLMVSVDDNIRSVSEYFVNKVFAEIDIDEDGKMTVEEALKYIADHPHVNDIYGMFGRSMTSQHQQSEEEKDRRTIRYLHSEQMRLRREGMRKQMAAEAEETSRRLKEVALGVHAPTQGKSSASIMNQLGNKISQASSLQNRRVSALPKMTKRKASAALSVKTTNKKMMIRTSSSIMMKTGSRKQPPSPFSAKIPQYSRMQSDNKTSKRLSLLNPKRKG